MKADVREHMEAALPAEGQCFRMRGSDEVFLRLNPERARRAFGDSPGVAGATIYMVKLRSGRLCSGLKCYVDCALRPVAVKRGVIIFEPAAPEDGPKHG